MIWAIALRPQKHLLSNINEKETAGLLFLAALWLLQT